MDKIKTFITKYLTWVDVDIAKLSLFIQLLNSRINNVNEYAESIDKRLKTVEKSKKKTVAKKKK